MKKNLMIVAALGVLATIGTVMKSGSPMDLNAQGKGQSVVIEGPLPLPVSQSGAWNVGITGTPNVNIANTPNVKVGNTASTGLFTIPLNESGRIGYQKTVSRTGQCGGATSCFYDFGFVPAGHRLVITHASGSHGITGVPIKVELIGDRSNGSALGSFMVPFVDLENGNSSSSYTQELLRYYEANDNVHFDVNTFPGTFTGGSVAQYLTLTGYMIDCTQFACEPLVQ